MPTGYTYDVGEGKVADFRVFALQCARNFGALIMMRDDPGDAPIPERFEPSTFYRDNLDRARIELRRLESLTMARVDDDARAHHATEHASWVERDVARKATEARYRAMLDQVRAWEPPTVEHVELKRFMVQQLEESIQFDCEHGYDHEPEPIADARAWHQERLKRAHENVKRYAGEWEAEQQRTESRNRWVQQLCDSLDEFQPVGDLQAPGGVAAATPDGCP